MKNKLLIILLAVAAAVSTHFVLTVGAKWLQDLAPGLSYWGCWLAILAGPIAGSLVLVKFFGNSELRNAAIAMILLLTPPLFFGLSFYWVGVVFGDWL